jgi:hypothetical protein
MLGCWSTADELDLVAVGIIDIHGAAGKDGMLSITRFIPSSS